MKSGLPKNFVGRALLIAVAVGILLALALPKSGRHGACASEHSTAVQAHVSQQPYSGRGKHGGNSRPDRLKHVLEHERIERQVITLSYKDKLFRIRMGEYANMRRVSYSPGVEDAQMLELIADKQGFGHMRALKYVFDGLVEDVERWLVSFADKQPKDATLSFDPSRQQMFQFTPHSIGRQTQRQRLYKQIYTAVLEGNDKQIDVVTTDIAPKVTEQELRRQACLRSRFVTGIAASTPDRKSNIATAFRAWDGKIVAPGETVSFNQIVGARTAERGYKQAKIILRGKFEDGLGGGVCQASTTLYNAALLADMYINSANPHSLNVGYVEPSFDAMVSMNHSDLEFTNRGDCPVYIHAYCTPYEAVAEFYGTALPYVIRRKSVTVKRTPPDSPEIKLDTDKQHTDLVFYTDESAYLTYPKDAVESKGYLQYLNKKGRVIKEVLLRKDKYMSQQGIIVRGSEPRPVAQDEGVYMSQTYTL